MLVNPIGATVLRYLYSNTWIVHSLQTNNSLHRPGGFCSKQVLASEDCCVRRISSLGTNGTYQHSDDSSRVETAVRALPPQAWRWTCACVEHNFLLLPFYLFNCSCRFQLYAGECSPPFSMRSTTRAASVPKERRNRTDAARGCRHHSPARQIGTSRVE
jgi:hypothetical protein